MTHEEWTRKVKRSHNIVIANPRSGSTLLLRLAGLAGKSHVAGDRTLESTKAIIDYYKAHTKDIESGNGVYGHLQLLERDGVFPDMYRGIDKDSEGRLLAVNIRAILLGYAHHPAPFYKTTILGFGNDLVAEFVHMLRDIYDRDGFNLNIIWLERDHSEIVESFKTTAGPGRETALNKPDVIYDMLYKQAKQFRDARKLGDIRLTYDQLVTDTQNVIESIGTYAYPLPISVKTILSKKIR